MKLGDKPAFPQAVDLRTYGGMTMREHYAGLAMQAMLGNPVLLDKIARDAKRTGEDRPMADLVADTAVSAAETLLDELDRRTPKTGAASVIP